MSEKPAQNESTAAPAQPTPEHLTTAAWTIPTFDGLVH